MEISKVSENSFEGERRRRRSGSVKRPKVDAMPSLITAVLMALILAVGPLVLGGARLWVWLPVQCAAIGLFAFQCVRLWRARGKYEYTINVADGAVMVFVLYAFVRYLTAPVEYEARLEMMNIIMYAGIYAVCRYGLVRTWHGLIILGTILAVACAVALFGFWLKANMDFMPYGERLHWHYAPRLVGTYGCPNHAGALFYLAIPIAVGFCLFADKYSWPVRIVVGFLGFVLLPGALFMTFSRGSYLALFFSALIALVFLVRLTVIRWWVVPILTVIGGGLATLVLLSSETLAPRLEEVQNVIQNNQWLTYVRVQLARDALLMLKDYPLFGSGPATFGLLHPRYHGEDYSTLAIYTHNDYLNLLTDYGLVGGVIVAVFIVAVSRRLWKKLDWTETWRLKLVRFSVLCGWAGILLHSLVDFNMHIEGNAAIVCALIGLGLRKSEDESESENDGANRVMNRIWPWGLAVVLVIFAYFWQVTARTFFPLNEARVLTTKSQDDASVDRAIELTKQSIAADPNNHQAAAFYGDLMRTLCAKSEDMEYRMKLGDISLNAYKHAIRLNPLDDTLLIRKAMMLDLIKNYSEAHELYQKAIRNQPHNGFFLNALGNHYWRTGDLHSALEAFERADRAPYGRQDAAKAIQFLRPIVDILKMP